ncbi:hypothetical protein AAKU55_005742, partial [Oxalobacteraceae bacterium GrIS 1.11]
GALLSSQMFVNFRHGGTLQEKVLHLVFENALSPSKKFSSGTNCAAKCLHPEDCILPTQPAVVLQNWV